MKTKQIDWPFDNKTAQASELIEVLVDAFLQGATWKRINVNQNIKWRGPKQGRLTGVTSLEFTDWLKAENLRYSLEDQGRNFLEEILCIAFQLGIEQGRRIMIERQSTSVETIRMYAEHTLSSLNRIEDKPVAPKELREAVRRVAKQKKQHKPST